jgi:DNA-binding NarL/FixJ family response regulator
MSKLPASDSPAGKVCRLAVVEDQPQLRRQLTKFLSELPEVALLSAFSSGEEALAPLLKLRPDVLLLDLELPGMSGLELLAEVKPKAPEVQVLILTTFDDEQKVYESVQGGASGYLVKRDAFDRLPAAIREVADGGTVIEPRLARRFWNYFQSIKASPRAADPYGLTPLERDLLGQIAKGLSNAEVGRALEIDRRTVRTHLLHVYRKMKVHSHVEAVVLALKAGLIALD